MERSEYGDEQQMLKGIAALLLSFSVLAAFLCVLPLSIRARVVSILRRGEAAARTFAIEQSGGALALPAVPDTDGDSRADALHIARCFRALACFFCGLYGSAVRRPFRGGAACATRAGDGIAGLYHEGAACDGLGRSGVYQHVMTAGRCRPAFSSGSHVLSIRTPSATRAWRRRRCCSDAGSGQINSRWYHSSSIAARRQSSTL